MLKWSAYDSELLPVGSSFNLLVRALKSMINKKQKKEKDDRRKDLLSIPFDKVH